MAKRKARRPVRAKGKQFTIRFTVDEMTYRDLMDRAKRFRRSVNQEAAIRVENSWTNMHLADIDRQLRNIHNSMGFMPGLPKQMENQIVVAMESASIHGRLDSIEELLGRPAGESWRPRGQNGDADDD